MCTFRKGVALRPGTDHKMAQARNGFSSADKTTPGSLSSGTTRPPSAYSKAPQTLQTAILPLQRGGHWALVRLTAQGCTLSARARI